MLPCGILTLTHETDQAGKNPNLPSILFHKVKDFLVTGTFSLRAIIYKIPKLGFLRDIQIYILIRS